MSYLCSGCGEVHEDLPDLGADKPDYWWGVPEEERDKRIDLTSDTCVIDNEDFFIRGVIEIPVLDYHRSFGLGVWISQKRENFYKYVENFDSGDIGPFFGWLSNRISYFAEDTTSLKTRAHFRGEGLRPSIELEPTDHPLSLAQHNGITFEKAWEIAHFYMNTGE